MKVKIAQQHLVYPDLLVIEPDVGALGLVYLIPWGADIESEIEMRVDEAAYARHLMLRHPSSGQHIPWDIEAVFVTRQAAPEATAATATDQSSLGETAKSNGADQVGKVLRNIAETTDLLYSMGINYFEWPAEWSCNLPVELSDSEHCRCLRRAFAWLLSGVRTWFSGVGKPPATAKARRKTWWEKRRRLREVRVKDFRLPGERSLALESADRRRDIIHLIYGHNGSGKSSFVESVEYVIAGKIARMEEVADDEDFRGSLVNRHVAAEAKREGRNAAAVVELHVNGLKRPIKTVAESRDCSKNAGSRIDAMSFRLDQAAMMRLMMAGPTERTEAYLRAFFPGEELALRQEARQAAEDATSTLHALPEGLKAALRPDRTADLTPKSVASRLAWITTDTPIQRDLLTAILPLPPNALKKLGTLDSRLIELGQRAEQEGLTKDQAAKLLTDLDSVLTPLATSLAEDLEQLNSAIPVLERLKDWHHVDSPDPTAKKLLTDLDQWLDAVAAADLLGRQLQVLGTTREIKTRGKRLPGDQQQVQFSLSQLDSLSEAALQEWRAGLAQQANEALSQLPTSVGHIKPAVVEGKSHAPPHLSPREIDALNEVSHQVALALNLDVSPPLPFGKSVMTAITQQKRVPYGVGIGDAGWADTVIKALNARLESLMKVPGSLRNSAERVGQLERVARAYQRLGNVEERLTSSFLAMLGGRESTESSADSANAEPELTARLSATGAYTALNEMKAVFTPASWAYEDVIVRVHDPDSGTSPTSGEVEWRTRDGASANLRLNTAQLNTITLAMFLLCAPRIDNNPLRLLILDDPFQGMDELTIACIAKGLRRLIRIWQLAMEEPFDLLVFLHGDESFERMRHEIPATVHQLPFQVPDRPDQSYPTHEPVQIKDGSRTSMAPLESLLSSLPVSKN